MQTLNKMGQWFIVIAICGIAVVGGGIVAVSEKGWPGLLLPILIATIIVWIGYQMKGETDGKED